MTQLTYNEAFDPYHTVFRFLRLREGCNIKKALHFDVLRILDFYLLFPFRIQGMSLHSEDIGWRGISRSYANLTPYGEIPDDLSIFSKMEPFQRAAVTSLCNVGALSEEAWSKDEVLFEEIELNENLILRCKELNHSMADILDILSAIIEHYPLLGRNGLKDRTGLLEFRYDAI